MDILKQKEARAAKVDEAEAIVKAADAEDRGMNEGEQTRFDACMAEADGLKADIERREKLEAEKAALDRPEERKTAPHVESTEDEQRIEVVHNYGTLKHFRGKTAAEDAYKFGTWLGGLMGIQTMRDRAGKLGLEYRVNNEGVNTAGAFLVPTVLNGPLAYNVDQYGTFRQFADVVPMSSDTASWPRQTGDVTTYYVGENAAATESELTWEQVNLTARKLAAYSKITNELSEDAVVMVADRVMGSMSRAIAQAEDTAGWTGTGAAATGGIDGVKNRISTVNGVTDGAGVVLSTGNLLSETVLTDLIAFVGRLPEYAEPNARWYMSKWVWIQCEKLVLAAGGITKSDLVDGMRDRVLLGYPVSICSGAMFPTSDANSQILACFGDLSMAAMFGDRRVFSMSVKEIGEDARYDRVSVIGFSRYDINVHDVGSSATEGPIIGLMSAAA